MTERNGSIGKDIGRLQGKVEGIEIQLDRLQTSVEGIKTSMDQARGGWKVALMLAGCGGAVGAMVMRYAPWIGGLPK